MQCLMCIKNIFGKVLSSISLRRTELLGPELTSDVVDTLNRQLKFIRKNTLCNVFLSSHITKTPRMSKTSVSTENYNYW